MTRVHLGQDQTPRWKKQTMSIRRDIREEQPWECHQSIGCVQQSPWIGSLEQIVTQTNLRKVTQTNGSLVPVKPRMSKQISKHGKLQQIYAKHVPWSLEVCIPIIGLKEHWFGEGYQTEWKNSDTVHTNDHAKITVFSNASWMFSANPRCNLDWNNCWQSLIFSHIITPNGTQNVDYHPTICTSQVSMRI